MEPPWQAIRLKASQRAEGGIKDDALTPFRTLHRSSEMNILTTMSTRLTVPFLDLKSHYRQHQAAFDGAMGAVIAEAAFVGGPWVEQFEAEFAAYCGTTHAVGVANGTVALWMALLAMGIGPGDEVITVPNSFIATAEAISFCGAKPVFVD